MTREEGMGLERNYQHRGGLLACSDTMFCCRVIRNSVHILNEIREASTIILSSCTQKSPFCQNTHSNQNSKSTEFPSSRFPPVLSVLFFFFLLLLFLSNVSHVWDDFEPIFMYSENFCRSRTHTATEHLVTKYSSGSIRGVGSSRIGPQRVLFLFLAFWFGSCFTEDVVFSVAMIKIRK